jgi:hypothetical protein
MIGRTQVLVAVGASMVVASVGSAATYRLFDHPDAAETPPPYGLRLDGLFTSVGGPAGITTFSFTDVLMTVSDNGGNLNIRVFGTVYGGRDTGAGYGYGEGSYAIDFNFTSKVVVNGTGFVVGADMVNNTGTLVALAGNADLAAGTTFNLHDKADDLGRSLIFAQDDFRLAGTGFEGLGYWVGRGWVQLEGSDSPAIRDFLFVGQLIPAPLAGSMGIAGLLGLAARRRR